MSKFLAIVILIVIHISCTSAKREYYETGEIKKETKSSYGDTLIITEFYKTGEIIYRYQMSDNDLNGYHYSFYSNGNIKNKAQFINGLKEGIQTTYNESNDLYIVSIWKNGKQNINTFQFLKNGKILEDITAIDYNISPDFTIKGDTTKIKVKFLSPFKIDKVYMDNQAPKKYINYDSIPKFSNIEYNDTEFIFMTKAYSTGLWNLKFDVLLKWNDDVKLYYTVIAEFNTGDLKNFNEWKLNKNYYSKQQCVLIKY